MKPSYITSTLFAAALVVAMPVRAVHAGVLPGTHGAAISSPIGPAYSSASGSEDSEESTRAEDALAESESDWLTSPPHPDRHNLWVPTVQWTVCLALTIPLFMIDPAFVNTGTVSADNFADAWSKPPVWDTDGAIANYVLHPVMGAEAYLMVRNRNYGPITSFLFATGVSVGWEYLFEAWVERPSGQDLLVTSPVGSLFGEFRFQLRRRVARWSPSTGRDALLILVDPIEALHRYVGKEFLNRSDEATDETTASSLNVGHDHARLMLSLQF